MPLQVDQIVRLVLTLLAGVKESPRVAAGREDVFP